MELTGGNDAYSPSYRRSSQGLRWLIVPVVPFLAAINASFYPSLRTLALPLGTLATLVRALNITTVYKHPWIILVLDHLHTSMSSKIIPQTQMQTTYTRHLNAISSIIVIFFGTYFRVP
ncbi:hypothetical protein F5Y02DRAFT_43209 [Annulohypoxylon stygium]|nr:hypothetical protein F5Y02DRAFT_43209 [Annulohypoxylon stygium]